MVHACPKSARPFADAEAIHKTHEDALNELLKDIDIPESSVHLIDEKPMNAIVHCQESLANIAVWLKVFGPMIWLSVKHFCACSHGDICLYFWSPLSRSLLSM